MHNHSIPLVILVQANSWLICEFKYNNYAISVVTSTKWYTTGFISPNIHSEILMSAFWNPLKWLLSFRTHITTQCLSNTWPLHALVQNDAGLQNYWYGFPWLKWIFCNYIRKLVCYLYLMFLQISMYISIIMDSSTCCYTPPLFAPYLWG